MASRGQSFKAPNTSSRPCNNSHFIGKETGSRRFSDLCPRSDSLESGDPRADRPCVWVSEPTLLITTSEPFSCYLFTRCISPIQSGWTYCCTSCSNHFSFNMSFFTLTTLASMGTCRPVLVKKTFPRTFYVLFTGACKLNQQKTD